MASYPINKKKPAASPDALADPNFLKYYAEVAKQPWAQQAYKERGDLPDRKSEDYTWFWEPEYYMNQSGLDPTKSATALRGDAVDYPDKNIINFEPTFKGEKQKEWDSPLYMNYDEEQKEEIAQGMMPRLSPMQDYLGLATKLLKGTPRSGPEATLKLESLRGLLNKLKKIHRHESTGLKGTEDLLRKLKKRSIKTDLSPAIALVDSWTGSNLLASYEKPMTRDERDLLVSQLQDKLAIYKDKRLQRNEDIAIKELEFETKLRQNELNRKVEIFKSKQQRQGKNLSRAKDAADLALKLQQLDIRKSDEERKRLKAMMGGGDEDFLKGAKKQADIQSVYTKIIKGVQDNDVLERAAKGLIEEEKGMAENVEGYKPRTRNQLYAQAANIMRAGQATTINEAFEVLSRQQEDFMRKQGFEITE